MSRRSFVDRDDKEWTVTGNRVGAGVVSKGGRIPEPKPWIHFKAGDLSFSGPSLKDLESMHDAELQSLLDQFKGREEM
jgi:hypothetical protein